MVEQSEVTASCVSDARRRLFVPRSIVVVGASPTRVTLGTRVLRHLVEFGYAGRLYAVHSSAKEILGVPAVPDIRELTEAPDCVCIAVGADQVLGILETSGRCGVGGAVVYASGFSETDALGHSRQAALAQIALDHKMAVCGPNCLGFINFHDRVAAYSAGVTEEFLAGDVGVISQSGLACIALTNTGRFGMSYAFSVGNSAVLGIADCMDVLADDPRTRVAIVFAETISSPSRFLQAASRMKAAGKPVIVLKVGQSRAGAAATAAHTGSLAGSAAAFRAFFERAGVVQVDDLDEAVETCVLLRQAKAPRGAGGLAIVNISGGEVALTCDLAESVNLKLAAIAESTIKKLESQLPNFSRPSNPLDATGSAVYDMEMLTNCLQTMAADPNVAAVAVTIDSPAALNARQAETFSRMSTAVASAAPGLSKPIFCYSNIGGGLHPKVCAPLEAANVPMLQGGLESLRAASLWLHWHQAVPASSLPIPKDWPFGHWAARLANGKPMTERESKAFLSDHGLPVTREGFAASEAEAVRVANQIGYPVVLKIESEDIPHKSDAGGVALDLGSEEEVRHAYEKVMAACRANMPEARLNGVVVQEMVRGGVEAIVGISKSPPLGPVIVVGAGGVLTELIQDSAVGFAPLGEGQAQQMIAATRLYKLLSGYRGSPPADIAGLVEMLERLSQLAVCYEDHISAIDINPVAVLAAGQGVRALDAVIFPASHSVQ